MTATRILRRAVQAEERFRLGAAPPSASAVAARPADRIAAIPQEMQQALDERSRRAEQLESQLTGLRQECDQLRATLAGLQEQISNAKDTAQRQGYADGLKSAELQLHRELAERVAEWQKSLEQSVRQYDGRVQEIQAQLTDVVAAAIGKLLGEHLVNPPSIRAAIEQTIREAGISGPARVLIAPSQFEQLTRFGASHLAALRERRLEIAPDLRITAGGCLIETANGLIDGRFEVQLARLKDIVAGHFANGSAGP